MAEKVKHYLLFLSEADKKQVKALTQISSKKQILGLREVAANLLGGNIPVESHQKAKLKRFNLFYRELSSKGVSRCRLVKIVTQSVYYFLVPDSY